MDEPLPQVGDVFCLKQINVDNTFEQYIKVAKIESQNRRFALNDKDTFERVVVKMTTTDSLIHDFVGVQKPSYDYISATTKIYDTQVVDAGRYFGISGAKGQISQHSQTISVDNIFAKLIPTNQIQTALTDITANNALSAYIGKQAVEIAINQNTQRLYVGNKIAPASLAINTANGTLTDKIHNVSTGTLYLNDTPMGVVDYGEGSIYLNTPMSVISLSFGVAGKVVEYSQSDVIVVDTPSPTFTYQFKVAPVKGTLSITYQAMSKKYTLSDDGTGRLVGVSDKHGTGNLNYETGSLSLSLGGVPDTHSVILITWATPVTSFDDSQKAHKIQRIINVGGMVSTISADVNGNTYTLDDKGRLVFNDKTFARLDKNLVIIDDLTTPFRLSASVGKQKSQTFNKLLVDNDTMTLHFDNAFAKGSLTLDYELNIDGKFWGTRRVFDTAQGKLTDRAGNEYGRVDYALNLAKLKGNTQITIKTAKFEQVEI